MQNSNLSTELTEEELKNLSQASPPKYTSKANPNPSPSKQPQNPSNGHSPTHAQPASAPIHTQNWDTLDEPVSATIKRDLLNVWRKMKKVIYPVGSDEDLLKNWDLWGPLLLCLSLAIVLSAENKGDQLTLMFSTTFVVVWIGSIIVTLNAKLLGGKISILQSVCVLGYCLFPLLISAIICFFVKIIFIRLIIVSVSLAWSVWSSVGFLSIDSLQEKRMLAVILFHLGLSCISVLLYFRLSNSAD
eukprot:NODE_338_length_10654_cov_0.207295.p2 type:complete len:245 gc:universal NODE_338_length_10654_cov_0.207295:4409-5143(+)